MRAADIVAQAVAAKDVGLGAGRVQREEVHRSEGFWKREPAKPEGRLPEGGLLRAKVLVA